MSRASLIALSSAAAIIASAVVATPTTAGSGDEPLRFAQATTTQKSDPLTQAPAEQQEPWSVNCLKDDNGALTACQLSQHVLIKKTGQRLLSVIVEPRPTKSGLSLLLVMSHGVLLPAGIEIEASGIEQIKLKYRLSDKDGVYAATEMTDKLLQSMKAGNELKVTVLAASRQRVTIPVSLNGFSAAFTKFSAAK